MAHGLRFALLAIPLWFAGVAVHAERMQLLAVEEPPASFVDERGAASGFAVDVVREIQRRVGNADPVTVQPETRVYDTGLRQSNVVLLSFSRTPEREANFHWIARIVRKPWVFYASPKRTLTLKSLDDVRRLDEVGVVAGDVRAVWLASQGLTNLLPADTHAQGVRLLLSGRTDVLFTEPQGVAFYCRVQGCPGGAPRPVWTPRASDVYILMSRRTGSAIAARWKAAADAARADGTLEKLGRRWVEESGRRFGVHAVWRDGVLDFCADAKHC